MYAHLDSRSDYIIYKQYSQRDKIFANNNLFTRRRLLICRVITDNIVRPTTIEFIIK